VAAKHASIGVFDQKLWSFEVEMVRFQFLVLLSLFFLSLALFYIKIEEQEEEGFNPWDVIILILIFRSR
jgi:hypothetical protein